MTDGEILRFENLIVSFGEKRVIDNLSFPLNPGKITAFVGESGSGKTMTALSIMNLLPKEADRRGKIFFKGQNVFELKGNELRKLRGSGIAMVFQEPFTALNPVMKVGAQIEEAVHAHNIVPKKDAASYIRNLLGTVKLPADIVSAYPHELSGGEGQRIMIAIALSCNPEILILDEPTTALDVITQKYVLDLVKEIQKKKNLTMIFITHDFSIVNFIADYVCVMKNGVLMEYGEKDKILKNPADDYTKKLIACVPKLGDKRKRLAVIAR